MGTVFYKIAGDGIVRHGGTVCKQLQGDTLLEGVVDIVVPNGDPTAVEGHASPVAAHGARSCRRCGHQIRHRAHIR